MSAYVWNESFMAQEVTYITEIDGTIVIIEHVPARVNTETGERLFTPETVERIQQLVWSRQTPVRVVEASVFEFAA